MSNDRRLRINELTRGSKNHRLLVVSQVLVMVKQLRNNIYQMQDRMASHIAKRKFLGCKPTIMEATCPNKSI